MNISRTLSAFRLSTALVLSACGGGGGGSDGGGGSGTPNETPQFLRTGFIEDRSGGLGTAVQTFDFTQIEAAGRRTVEIRNWQRIGSLGWQSNQQFTADYQANDGQVSFRSPTGFVETLTFLEVRTDSLIVRDAAGATRQLFNCTAAGWPELIKASNRAC